METTCVDHFVPFISSVFLPSEKMERNVGKHRKDLKSIRFLFTFCSLSTSELLSPSLKKVLNFRIGLLDPGRRCFWKENSTSLARE